MKRTLPLVLVGLFGLLGIATYFIPHPTVQTYDSMFGTNTLRLIAVFGLVLGLSSLVRHHIERIVRRREHYAYSWITLVSLAVTGVIGLLGGGMSPAAHGLLPTRVAGFSFHISTLYTYIMIPVSATMFALLAFFMASASYRAFRARNAEATLLLVAAFIVMLGSVPLSRRIIDSLPSFAQYIVDIPNTASKRGIGFGITLGAIATSLKILLGIERGWLGGEK